MTRKLMLTLASVCFAAQAGCPFLVSLNPLSDPETAKPDRRLIGTWRMYADGKPTSSFLHIGRSGRIREWQRFANFETRKTLREMLRKYPQRFKNLMLLVRVDTRKELETLEAQVQLFFPTQLDGQHFANVPFYYADEDKDFFGGRKHGYWICKYEVTGDRLRIESLVADKLKEAIKSGHLAGDIEGPFLTDTTANLRKFLTSPAARDLWRYEGTGEFRRVK